MIPNLPALLTAPCLRTAPLTLALLVALLLAGCETNVSLREKGRASMRAGDYPAAIDYFQEAVNRRPTDVQARYYLGRSHMALNQYLQAQLVLERAYELRSNDPEFTPRILDALAESLYQQDRIDAMHSFLSNRASQTHHSDDYLRLAKYLRRAGDLDGARLAYRKAAHFADRRDVTPYLAIADFYESINDAPNTVIALRYAYWVNPNNRTVHNRLRAHGIVPGPTVAAEPPRPELLDE